MASGFKDHFSERSGLYATFRPVYPPALVELLAGLCRSTNAAWDVGCGSGQLSALLAQRFTHVFATDASAEQVAKARPVPGVLYSAAPAERSGLTDRSVDLVVAAQAAHWFDLPAFYAEVRRVSKPGGVVALVCYEKCVIDGGPIDAAVERLYSNVLGPYWPPERRHVETGYAQLPFPFDDIAAAERPVIEMSAVWTRDQLAGYLGTWSAVRAAEKAGVKDVLGGFNAELERAWPDVEAARPVVWPLSMRVGRVAG
ncbi:MAG: class I SAM-dependent methyltransferase [Phycisphaerales bacterium]